MRRSIFVLALATLLVTYGGAFQTQKDVVRRVTTVRGKVVGFEAGDYVHALIKSGKGGETSYFIDGEGLEYFLASHANAKGSFKIQDVDTTIPEAGGRMRVERISDATIGGTRYGKWWRSLKRKFTMEQIEKRYRPLVEKLTRNGG